MEVLAALERHRHFAAAAAACGISQPAFSARIRNLEKNLGVAIVNRGNRFQGFTDDGRILLRWAHRLLQDADGLRQDISAAKGNLTGRLVLGVVPTALAFAAKVPAILRAAHPAVTVELVSATSVAVRRGVRDFSLSAGLSYIGGEEVPGVRETPLYEEEYCLLGHDSLFGTRTEISWTAAAQLPLCLLSRDMQNRQIIDAVFEKCGVTPSPVMETNALTAIMVTLASGTSASILPRQFIENVALPPGLRHITLSEPVARHGIGLLLPDRQPEPPTHGALRTALNALLS